MDRTWLSILLLLCACFSSVNGNLFPPRKDNWWLFNYTIQGGGIGARAQDSGNIRWHCMGVIHGDATYRIKIRQERQLLRKTMTLTTNPPVIRYDSIFNPPRRTVDTLTLTGQYGFNGLRINSDSCVALLHQPHCTTNVCSLATVQAKYRGTTVTGYEVDPLPCRNKGRLPGVCVMPSVFTQADGIGPVGFRSSLQPCMFDAIRNEQWTLVDYSAANQWILPDTVKADTSALLTLVTLEYTCMPDSFQKSVTANAQSIRLTYKPDYNPLRDCLPMPWMQAQCYFTLPPLAAGKYPVFIESRPSCYPACLIPVRIECIDTLVVSGTTSLRPKSTGCISGRPSVGRLHTLMGGLVLDLPGAPNGIEARLLNAHGRLLDRGRVWAGAVRFRSVQTAHAAIVFVSLDNGTCRPCFIERKNTR